MTMVGSSPMQNMNNEYTCWGLLQIHDLLKSYFYLLKLIGTTNDKLDNLGKNLVWMEEPRVII